MNIADPPPLDSANITDFSENLNIVDETKEPSTPDIQIEKAIDDEKEGALETFDSQVLEDNSQAEEQIENDSDITEKVLDEEVEKLNASTKDDELSECVAEPNINIEEPIEITEVETELAEDCQLKECVASPSGNTLTVNKRFFVNTLKQVDDHNRYRINQESKTLRKFQNEERKRHTIKNLQHFSPQKTLYSDFFEVSLNSKKKLKQGRVKVITPLEQVKKLLDSPSDNDIESANKETNMSRVVKKSRFSIDKTLLNNHLKHYSVHNRLKEENEMWEKHNSPAQSKVQGLQSTSSKRKQAAKRPKIGGMYADREPGGDVKTTKFKEIPDDAPSSIGSATQELLDYEESMPDRWGHSGFKEVYVDKPNITIKRDGRKSNSRRVVIGSDLSGRLNNSIELSDDDEVKVIRKKQKKDSSSRSILIHNEPETLIRRRVGMITKKRSVVSTASKARVKVVNSTASKRINIGTLQSDLIGNKSSQKVVKRNRSPERWGHDGFKRNSEETFRPPTKSKVVASASDDSSEEEMVEFSHNNAKHSKSKNLIKNRQREPSSELTDSDEWTEKEEVDSNLARNDARRKLKQNSNKRVEMKTAAKSSIKSRIGKRRDASDDYDDSSLTDSSSDERYKQKIHNKPRREEQKFYRR